jgi:hypothetical protein
MCGKTWIRFISAALLLMVTGCNDPLDGSDLKIEALCLLSATAHQAQDFNGLLIELERQVGVAQNKIRITGGVVP